MIKFPSSRHFELLTKNNSDINAKPISAAHAKRTNLKKKKITITVIKFWNAKALSQNTAKLGYAV